MADVLVVGAGAFGLAVALELLRGGAAVRVAAAPGPRSASAVAAGMLAPVCETLEAGGDRAHLARLLAARARWDDWAGRLPGLALDRNGTILLPADAAGRTATMERLRALGVAWRPAEALGAMGLHLLQEHRLDTEAALSALRTAVGQAGGRLHTGVAMRTATGLRLDGEPPPEPAVVLAAGFGTRALSRPEDAAARALSPIKGHILTLEPAPSMTGPTVRRGALYLAPQAGGSVRAGATREPGRDDAWVDPATAARLHAEVLSLAPGLAGAPWRAQAGVRAATPDGWPLAGPSGEAGVWLATGARRNGWLLAPLVAEVVAAAVLGREAPGEAAAAFHPARFPR